MKCCLNLPAPAKLNLFLHVIGRKPDGMHLLGFGKRSLLQSGKAYAAIRSAPWGPDHGPKEHS